MMIGAVAGRQTGWTAMPLGTAMLELVMPMVMTAVMPSTGHRRGRRLRDSGHTRQAR